MKKILAIDGFSLLHRAYYAMPFLTNSSGVPTGAVTGFLNMLINAIEKTEPDYIAVAMDMKGPTFRHELYSDYKGNRPPMPDELRQQVKTLREILDGCGIQIVESQGYEADDVLGTISHLCSEKGINTIILTGDRDSFQLINENTSVWMTRKGITEIEVFDRKHLFDEYGLEPWQIVDLKGLMGDQSDNIPGIPMVGMKTALKLLAEYQSLSNVLLNADKISGKKLKSNLIEFKDQALLSYDLAKINSNVETVEFASELYAFSWDTFQNGIALLRELELNSILSKLEKHFQKKAETLFPAKEKPVEEQTVSNIQSLESLIQGLLNEESIAIHSSDKELSIYSGNILYHIPIASSMIDTDALPSAVVYDSVGKLFGSACEKTVYDLKSWLYKAKSNHFSINNCSFDVLIAAYIINSNSNDYSIQHLAESVLSCSEENAYVLAMLKDSFAEQLKDMKCEYLFHEIEMPLIRVLFEMENNGFKTDKTIIKELDLKISDDIKKTEERIFLNCGERFNINSPKQLSVILFEKMGLKPVKKTKSGFSTDAETLEQLSYTSDFVADILSYRQLSKLKGTYIDGLLPLIDKNDRIHSTFNQTVASTGRISSSEPNLQNIPVRTKLGREFRKVFVADNEKDVLIDADYSQIELRVLAHLSGDKIMREAFLNGYDIHKDTASKMWHVSPDEVTSEMRSAAKAINFGIVYGISDFGLSRNIGISVSEARDFIERYKNTYTGVSEYMNELVDIAKRKGYAETMFGRRRMIPELNSSQYNTRAFGSRIAMNMPIQGTAADIIKLAMNRMHSVLDGDKAKLLLQVHDELIINSVKECAFRVSEIMKKEMESVVCLSVPLTVEVKIGRSWYDTK